jgi:hypothetical protein
MPNTLLAIQYTPIAAGMTKQIHIDIKGMTTFMLFIDAAAASLPDDPD